MNKLNKAQKKRLDEWVDREGVIITEREYQVTKQHLADELDLQKRKLIIWIAEYVYYKVNPESTMDIPSIVYEQVEKDVNKFLDKDQAIKSIK